MATGLLKEPTVAKGKQRPPEPQRADEPMSERLIFHAGPEWVERMDVARRKLGLSMAAFIRMSCEKEARRLEGKSDGD